MIKEAIEKILSLAPATQYEIGGHHYTSSGLVPVKEPTATPLKLSTLTGIKDYLATELDGLFLDDVVLHVDDFRTVSVIRPLTNDSRQREVLAIATAQECGFKFGTYLYREDFQVGLMSIFYPTALRDDVIRNINNINVSTGVDVADDGISQRVTARTGIARLSQIDLPNPVTLKPYRTFAEAEQPESDFVFRIRQQKEGGAVESALFEADGGRWKLQAALNIKTWLVENIPGVRVIV